MTSSRQRSAAEGPPVPPESSIPSDPPPQIDPKARAVEIPASDIPPPMPPASPLFPLRNSAPKRWLCELRDIYRPYSHLIFQQIGAGNLEEPLLLQPEKAVLLEERFELVCLYQRIQGGWEPAPLPADYRIADSSRRFIEEKVLSDKEFLQTSEAAELIFRALCLPGFPPTGLAKHRGAMQDWSILYDEDPLHAALVPGAFVFAELPDLSFNETFTWSDLVDQVHGFRDHDGPVALALTDDRSVRQLLDDCDFTYEVNGATAITPNTKLLAVHEPGAY